MGHILEYPEANRRSEEASKRDQQGNLKKLGLQRSLTVPVTTAVPKNLDLKNYMTK